MSLTVINEPTPNPLSMKFKVNQIISEESATIDSKLNAERSPLAQKIFGFPWAQAVHIGPDFITITKQDWVGWEILSSPLCELIKEHLENQWPVLHPKGESEIKSNDPPVVQKIKQFLDQEVRPFVAMDGGDILFSDFREGVLSIHMRGACSGCPSSTITLKNGIEARIKLKIPEVKEVISV